LVIGSNFNNQCGMKEGEIGELQQGKIITLSATPVKNARLL
jgi:hypothetical protein